MVNCTLVQALRLCTGRTAHGGSRGMALPFLDHGTRRGWGVSVTPRPLFTPRERSGTHCTGVWVGPRAGLDRCGKPRPHRDSIPLASRYTDYATRHTLKYSVTRLKRRFMRHLACNVRYSLEPINSSLSITTLYCSVTKTPLYNDTKYSVPSHNVITGFQCINTAFSDYLTWRTRSSPR